MFIVLRSTTFICTLTFSLPRFTTLIVPDFSVRPRSTHSGQTQKSNTTPGFRRLELRKCLNILVPRGRAPFGQHQESRPLATSNTRSPRFTDFLLLCACSRVKSDKSDWFWSQSIVFSKPFKTRTSLDLARGRDSWC